MTSRRHYVKKHNTILHKSNLSRGINVPDTYLTPEQLEFRRFLQALLLRINAKDKHSLKNKEDNKI